MLRGMTHVDNAYNCKNVRYDSVYGCSQQMLTRNKKSNEFPYRVEGFCCKTNIPSNTAFRTFGAPQGQIVVEQAMEDIAYKLGLSASEVRYKNLYRDGDTSHINAILSECHLTKAS